MGTIVRPDSLRNRARMALVERREVEAEAEINRRSVRRERFTSWLGSILGTKPETETVMFIWYGDEATPIAEIDCIVFGLRHEFLRLRGDCLECGANVWSKPISSLADVGALIERFEPEFEHNRGCLVEAKAGPTIAEQLADLLRELLRDG